ncbi:MAG: trypsin-like peptidase domain-containing protein [Lachnospiraceae bacterium]|nr:trypsin-like peptidase domain-containing protein [Lachnospiraceae bacterium]
MESNQNETLFSSSTPSFTDLPETPAEHSVSEDYHFWAEETVLAQPSAEAETAVFSESPAVTPAEPVETGERSGKKRGRFLKKFFGGIAAAICFGAFAGAAFFGVRHAYSYFFPEKTDVYESILNGNEPTPYRPNITIAATALSPTGDMDASETVSKVVEQTMPSMVSIKAVYTTTSYFFGRPYTEESEGGGSGIIVGSNDNDLLIATNYHVIEDTSSLQVILADNTSHTVTVKGSDPDADLAILALPFSDLTEDTLSKIDIAVLGDSDSSKIGQMVIAIGNALGYGPSVTVGYLSAKDREVTIEGNDMILLQTNAAINAGNSGGALLNTKGEVIGINNAKLSSTDIEGICFAIPISMATPILDDLMTREILSDEEKGYLGVSLNELDPSIFRLYNWPEGVYVNSVSKDSAAEKAGIYPGDIITHVNGVKVTTANQLINAVTSHRYGTVIEVTLQRINEGKFTEYTFSVTLQQNPELQSSQNRK